MSDQTLAGACTEERALEERDEARPRSGLALGGCSHSKAGTVRTHPLAAAPASLGASARSDAALERN